MSFSHSSGIITQTGTDTSLSGLSGLTGVTVYDNIYLLNNVFLRVDGDLTFNGMDERLVFVNPDDTGTGVDYASIYVHSGGSLTVECDRGVQVGKFTETTLFAPVIDFGTRNIPNTSGSSTSYSNGRKFISVHPSGEITLSGVIVGETSNTSNGILTAVQRDSGVYSSISYSAYSGSTFTITSTDFSSDNSTSGNNVFISYIDELSSGTTATFTTVYDSDRTLFIRVRDGGGTPIKTFETTGTLGNAGGSSTAIRTSDA